MTFFKTIVQLQFELFSLMTIGFICKKIKIINIEAQKSLSDLLIYIILPFNIIHSFTSGLEVSSDLLHNCLLAFFISLIIQLFAAYASRWVFRKWPQKKGHVASYGIIVSNSSFIGIPMTEHAYGNLGVLYTSVFQIPIRFTMWSSGLALFTAVDKKMAVKKVLTHPCILACIGGFALMLSGITFSGFIEDTVVAMSRCTGPVSMIVIGAILSDAKIAQLFQKDVFFFCFLRLVFLPLVVWAILSVFHVNEIVTGISVLLTAMPAGSTTAILPQKYDYDATYGASLIFTSTLLSIITVPAISLLLG